jgi:transposase
MRRECLVHRSRQGAKIKQTSGPTKKAPAETVLKDIRRATRRHFSAEEQTRIMPVGLHLFQTFAILSRIKVSSDETAD